MKFFSFLVASCFAVACVDSPNQTNQTKIRASPCDNPCKAGETKCDTDQTGNLVFYRCIEDDATDQTGVCTMWDIQTCGMGQTCNDNLGCECELSCTPGAIDCADLSDPLRCVQPGTCSAWVSDCTTCDECDAVGRACIDACPETPGSTCKQCVELPAD